MEGAAPDPTSVWLPEPLTQERAPDAPPLAESQLGDQTTWGQPGAQDPRPSKKHKNTPQQKEKQRQRQQEYLGAVAERVVRVVLCRHPRVHGNLRPAPPPRQTSAQSVSRGA